MGTDGMPDELTVEFAELVADIRSALEWEAIQGGTLVPVDAVTVSPAPAVAAASPAHGRPGQFVRPTPPKRRVSKAKATPTVPSPLRQRPASPAPSPKPTESTEPVNIGKWAAYVQPEEPSAIGTSGAEGGDSTADHLSQAASLEEVLAVLGPCSRCGLCEGRKNVVFGVGDPNAELMVIGGGPAVHEDRAGEPFVGPAGEMLDRMLEKVVGIGRKQVYITNVLKCKPQVGRHPSTQEIDTCLPFLWAQVRQVRPRFLLLMGDVAVRSVLGTRQGVKSLRGRWQTVSQPWADVQAMATFHPGYLLGAPHDKRVVFQDLMALKEAMHETMDTQGR